MFLSLALDSIESLNNSQPVIINLVLDRVTNMMSDRFFESLFEEKRLILDKTLDFST